MERLKKIALLINLVKQLKDKGSWTGETHIQKATYLLQEITNIFLGFQFILYKHGPFSFDLRDELTALRADGLVGLQHNYPYGPSFFITNGGKELMKKMPNTVGKYSKKISRIAEECGSNGVAELERLATAMYVRVEVDNPGERANRLHKLKPHIDIQSAQKAINKIDACCKEFSIS